VVTLSASGKGGPTRYGKRLMAQLYYKKGCHFVAAAILLRKQKGDEYVVLHLICQGVEIMIKALLLLRNFEKYQPIVERRYRHRLVPLASDALSEFKLNPLRSPLSTELRELGRMYAEHILRYSLLAGVFIDPKTISSELVLRRTAAVLRLADREMRKASRE
jgi:hypothetical protein